MSHQNNSSKPAAAPSVEELLASNPALAAFVASQAAQLAAQQIASLPRGGRPKTPCTITREEFLADAEALEIVLDGNTLTAEPKEFTSGGFGWYIGGRMGMPVGGRTITCQVGINVSVVNSKETEGAAEAAAKVKAEKAAKAALAKAA